MQIRVRGVHRSQSPSQGTACTWNWFGFSVVFSCFCTVASAEMREQAQTTLAALQPTGLGGNEGARARFPSRARVRGGENGPSGRSPRRNKVTIQLPWPTSISRPKCYVRGRITRDPAADVNSPLVNLRCTTWIEQHRSHILSTIQIRGVKTDNIK